MKANHPSGTSRNLTQWVRIPNRPNTHDLVDISIRTPLLIRGWDGVLAELGIPTVQLVKMDVDGFESEVLRGATALLRDSGPIFMMELSPYVLVERGSSVEELISFFIPNGYHFFHERTGERLPSASGDLGRLVGDGESMNVVARAT
jgi:hypothetical protein